MAGLSMHCQRTLQSPSKSFLSFVPSANTHAMDGWGEIAFLWQLAMLTPQLCSFLFIAHLEWVAQCMVFTAFMSTSWVLHPCIPTDMRPQAVKPNFLPFPLHFSALTVALHTDGWFCLRAQTAWFFLQLSPKVLSSTSSPLDGGWGCCYIFILVPLYSLSCG